MFGAWFQQNFSTGPEPENRSAQDTCADARLSTWFGNVCISCENKGWHTSCFSRAVITNRLALAALLCVLSSCHDKGAQREDLARSGAPTVPSVETEVHLPDRLIAVDMGKDGRDGKVQRVRCETCHALRPAAPVPDNVAALDEFHVGMKFAHGPVECASCHAPGQPPRLRLANGELLATRDALRLCAQCHGPQYRDYQHGAHGGMSGYWDSSRGARVRNHCVDCHDPHAPQITAVMPDSPPKDRYFTKGAHQ